MEDKGRQATPGPTRAVQTEQECPLVGLFYSRLWGGGGGGGARERGRKQFPMLSPWLGRGWPESLGLTQRQCGLVTVRGKHRATNGVVMGGEEPGKS